MNLKHDVKCPECSIVRCKCASEDKFITRIRQRHNSSYTKSRELKTQLTNLFKEISPRLSAIDKYKKGFVPLNPKDKTTNLLHLTQVIPNLAD